jgi:hypothetical protein
MDSLSDMYVDLDTKNRAPSIWVPYLLKESEKYDSDILNRIIIEFYNETNYALIDSIHHFSNYMYSVYLTDYFTDEDRKGINDFCIKNSISLVVYPSNSLNEEFINICRRNNLYVIAYSGLADDINGFNALKDMGVVGIQTDWVTQKMWDSN